MNLSRPRVALLFGSFNPIHLGHLILANYVVEFEGFDQVWFVVTPHNPLKDQSGLLDEHLRLQLTESAVSDNSRFQASDVEFFLPRPSFTIQTLEELRRQYPNTEFHLLIGSDNWTIFPKWKDYQRIMDEFPIMIYPRKGDCISPSTITSPLVRLIEAPEIEISSTFIRHAYQQGWDPSFLLPQAVAHIIQKNNLYKL